METIRARYRIVANDIDRAAWLVAREQSLGVRVTPFESNNVKRLEASVVSVRPNGKAADVEIDVASENIASAYGLVLSIAGEISCLGALKSIQLTDFEIPERLAKVLGGPIWGAEGLRSRLGVHDRPLFTCVVKPSQGLSPKEFAKLAYELLVGGIDIAKTDELLQESREDTLDRVRAAVDAVRRAEDETGEKKLFMIHAVGPAGEIRELFEAGIGVGAGIAMACPAALGFPVFHELARLGRVPIMAHMAMSAWLWQPHGMSVLAWSKFMRLLGADVILYPALQGTLKAERRDLEDVRNVCAAPWHGMLKSLPAVGGGMTAAALPVHARLFGKEFMFLCGGGLIGHPEGPRAGARSVRQAWDAFQQGVSLSRYAGRAPELKRALSSIPPPG